MYRRISEGNKSFALMHCYSKLKKNHKWQLTRLFLSKGKDAIDLDAPLVTSAGRPIGKKAAKADLADAVLTKKTQESITQCLVEVSSTLLSRDKKNRRKVGGVVQEVRGEDGAQETQGRHVPADSVDRRNVSPYTGRAQLLQMPDPRRHQSQNGGGRGGSQEAAATPTSEQEPADASATTSAGTPASASASAIEHAHREDHDEIVVIYGPASTQDAPSASPNPFPFF
jgi:hypothetical protein